MLTFRFSKNVENIGAILFQIVEVLHLFSIQNPNERTALMSCIALFPISKLIPKNISIYKIQNYVPQKFKYTIYFSDED